MYSEPSTEGDAIALFKALMGCPTLRTKVIVKRMAYVCGALCDEFLTHQLVGSVVDYRGDNG